MSNLWVVTSQKSADSSSDPVDAPQRLRTAGLRSTPQRRAILGVFRGGTTEHLSADEVYAQASRAVPDISRGTVYAALAEFTEVGLLSAVGAPEPVRYEISSEEHAHFRCLICMRLFDVHASAPSTAPFRRLGHEVKRADLRAEGFCGDCQEYAAGLQSGTQSIMTSGASDSLHGREATAMAIDSPLGRLLVAATPAGLVRVAFPEHGDIPFLETLLGRRSSASQSHLDAVRAQLGLYFAGRGATVSGLIDWELLGSSADALQAAIEIPYGARRSYELLHAASGAAELGHIFGTNPIPIVSPCHRVSRGVFSLNSFVGGLERRDWLLSRERSLA